nr:hypothetical protein [Tanacetum cinerariifolium]
MLKSISTSRRSSLLALAARSNSRSRIQLPPLRAGFHSSDVLPASSAEPIWLKSPRDVSSVLHSFFPKLTTEPVARTTSR